MAQYEIDLDGVDSAGETECDVMEISASRTASRTSRARSLATPPALTRARAPSCPPCRAPLRAVGRLDCKKETQEMLLDNFMQGSIHKLYEEKWYRYGAPIHYIKLVMHLMYLGQLAWMAFSLKSSPMETTNSKVRPARRADVYRAEPAAESPSDNVLPAVWRRRTPRCSSASS